MSHQVTIIGLGQVGVSIGLALAARKDALLRVGHDREPGVARRAEKLGAIDHIHHNLPAAAENADVVVLALPEHELQPVLEVIGKAVKPTAMVVNTSRLVAPVFGWAQQSLPAGQTLVSITPTLNPEYLEGNPSAHTVMDACLFKDSLAVITQPAGTPTEAIEFAVEFCRLLGCRPYFAGSEEADGLFAASHLLPSLLAAALMNSISNQPGWRDAGRLAGASFAHMTASLSDENQPSAGTATAVCLNRDSTIRLLQAYIDDLEHLLELVQKGEEASLTAWLEDAASRRQAWLKSRRTVDGTPGSPTVDLPSASETFGRLFGFGPRRKTRG